MPKTVRLAVYFNNELRAIRELAVPFVIGRSHDANLTIPHPMVSRRHCLIFEENGMFCLQDLGSLNGTFHGQERITDLELRDGTEFLIGTIHFVFNPATTLEVPLLPAVSDSDIVKTEIILESLDDLPPPLPPGVAKTPQPMPIPAPVAPAVQKSPAFIKPLPQFTSIQDGDINFPELNDVIDLAGVTDKEASTPPSLLLQVRK